MYLPNNTILNKIPTIIRTRIDCVHLSSLLHNDLHTKTMSLNYL